jgi:hypothetical protein
MIGSHVHKWLALAGTLVGAILLGFAAAQPPSPLPADAPADRFSAGRAMADVRVIAREPHPSGSVANDVARAHLTERLRALGFTVRQTAVPLPAKARAHVAKRGAPAETAVNIIGLRPGRDPAAPAVLLMAHYDSVPGSPGAADDASGVAAALEIARAIPQADQARDLIVLLTDGEEAGLIGARGFFGRDRDAKAMRDDPLAGRTGVVINMESRGGGGRAMMFETGPNNGNMIGLLRRVVGDPAANSLAVKIYELLPNDTDFTPARQRGLPGYNFAFIGDARQYHSPVATPDALDQGALQHMGGQGLDLARALLTDAALPAPADDAVFSDVLGAFVIAYPPAFGWVFVAISLGLLVIIARRRAADWTLRPVVGGLLAGLGFLAVAAALLFGGNLLSGADGTPNYYDRLAALPRLELQALLVVAAALALVIAVRPRGQFWGNWLGLATLSMVMATALQVFLPAAAPIIAWPLLMALIAMLPVSRQLRVEGLMLVPPMLAAIVGLAFLGSFGHFFMLGVGITAPFVIAIFAPLGLLLLWPLVPEMQRRTALITAGMILAAAAALALWVRLDPPAVSIPPYSNDKPS